MYVIGNLVLNSRGIYGNYASIRVFQFDTSGVDVNSPKLSFFIGDTPNKICCSGSSVSVGL